MKIRITKLTNWNDVLNSARFTRRKELVDTVPSIKFRRDMVIAEHSPLRCLQFFIDMYDIPYYVSVHFVRHVHAQPFASTSRPDIDGNVPPREEQRKTDLVNLRLLVNAQEIIHISRLRLCRCAEKETRQVWEAVIKELEYIEPILAKACVPSCIYRGFCPELKCCGYCYTWPWEDERNEYLNIRYENS